MSIAEVGMAEKGYFEVIHNHRQSQIRKSRRRIMKDRRKQQKRIQIEEAFEEGKMRNEILNQNMLKEEEIWDVLLFDE